MSRTLAAGNRRKVSLNVNFILDRRWEEFVRKPRADHNYILVRVTDGHIEQADFTRFSDDSVSIISEGHATIIEFTPNAWEKAWIDLEARGFVELREARSAGLVPPEWEPTK